MTYYGPALTLIRAIVFSQAERLWPLPDTPLDRATYWKCVAKMGDNLTDRGARGVIKSPYWQIMRDCADAMATIGSRFGLTPADRAKLSISPDQPVKSGAERILA